MCENFASFCIVSIFKQKVDPNDPDTSNSNCRDGGNCCRTPIVPAEGGNYESNAFWVSPSENKYHFYTTEDKSSNYRLTRVSWFLFFLLHHLAPCSNFVLFVSQFVPDDNISTMLAKPRKLDRLCGASGQLRYLQLTCTANCGTNRPSGTYSWSTSRTPASGDQAYPNAEGIDVKGNDLYFVTKNQRRLYIVDLAGSTWRSGETIQSNSGETFSPDQITRITGSNSPNDILYFTEDGSGTQDIHARGMDSEGAYRFFTIVRGYSSSETVGLTFSLDNKMMYFAHQVSVVVDCRKEETEQQQKGFVVHLPVLAASFCRRILRKFGKFGVTTVVPLGTGTILM